ncbi:MAG: DUF2865 domain-containing protein [Pseudomonadota bacterium]
MRETLNQFTRIGKISSVALLCFAIQYGAWTADAQAQSAVCLQLTNELAALNSGGGFSGGSKQYREYDRAVRDQRAQIAKTENALRRNGCILSGLFRVGICGRIRASLDQMQDNLRQLERTRASHAPSGGGNSARRNAVMRDIQRYGCQVSRSNQAFAVQNQAPRRRTLLEQIFGVRTYGEDGYRTRNDFDPDTGLASRYGTFRTLCVRTCDGYYFPISFSTVSERFGDDELTCENMCPGTDVELYFHRMPNQDSEDMISYRTDLPYTELPTAFDYRKTFDESCTCRTSNAFAEVYGDAYISTSELSSVTTPADNTPKVGTPEFKIDPWIDPETQANLDGGLTLAGLQEIASPKARPDLITETSGGKTVRIVGPSFFPVQ